MASVCWLSSFEFGLESLAFGGVWGPSFGTGPFRANLATRMARSRNRRRTLSLPSFNSRSMESNDGGYGRSAPTVFPAVK